MSKIKHNTTIISEHKDIVDVVEMVLDGEDVFPEILHMEIEDDRVSLAVWFRRTPYDGRKPLMRIEFPFTVLEDWAEARRLSALVRLRSSDRPQNSDEEAEIPE